MQINKQLLLVTFIISAHGAIISMEPSVAKIVSEGSPAMAGKQETELMKACKLVNEATHKANKEAKIKAKLIMHFTRDSSTDTVRNRQEMESVGTWLT